MRFLFGFLDKLFQPVCRINYFRACPRNHPCKLFCYEKCQKCNVPVELTLPCEHKKRLPCHTDENTYLCDAIVDDVSPFCKHNVKRKCHQKVEDVQCPVPCEDRLECGHACTRNCHKNDDPDHIQVSSHHFVICFLLVFPVQ